MVATCLASLAQHGQSYLSTLTPTIEIEPSLRQFCPGNPIQRLVLNFEIFL